MQREFLDSTYEGMCTRSCLKENVGINGHSHSVSIKGLPILTRFPGRKKRKTSRPVLRQTVDSIGAPGSYH
jgi:hypothetical protein